MIIKGTEYGLEFSFKAYIDVVNICPDKKFENIDRLTTANEEVDDVQRIKNYFALAEILNEAYLARLAHEMPGRTAPRFADLPEADREFIPFEEINALIIDVTNTIINGKRYMTQAKAPAEPGNVAAAV